MPEPIDSLDAPIDWRDPALWPILSDLQGNILKGHGRDHTQNIFLRFDPHRVADVRKAIRSLAANVTSALTQLRETSVFKIVGRSGGTAVYLALSAAGYRAIGLTPPGNPAFLDGMAARAAALHDPEEETWEDHLRGVHALLIVADDSNVLVANAAALLTAGLAQSGISILGRDSGCVPAACVGPGVGGKGDGVEEVGNAGGRRQPLLLAEDVAAEREKEGSFIWDPGFSPRDCALVRDPHGGFGDSFGSYLVYRKLEQNGAGLQLCENALTAALANALGMIGQARNRAGTFDDVAGGCPMRWPVRKAHPWGDMQERLGTVTQAGRSHLMPRRGIPYGERTDISDPEASRAGLLFMAYNADIGRQFEFTQMSWANSPAFVGDALASAPNDAMEAIGGPGMSGMAVQPQCWRVGYDAPPGASSHFAYSNFVRMRGGEYLFAPSLSALAAL